MAKVTVACRAELDVPLSGHGYSITREKLEDFLNQLPTGARLTFDTVKGGKQTLVAEWTGSINPDGWVG